MKYPLVIGIGHKLGSGKDTFAGFLAEAAHAVGKVATIRHFADPLKEGIGRHIFGLTDRQMYTEAGKSEIDLFWKMAPRVILQKAGSEAMRGTFGPYIWTSVFERWCQANGSGFHLIIVPDVRFLSEVETARRLGGILIRVDRLRVHNTAGRHISETELEMYTGWDYIINNSTDLTSLQQAANDCIKSIFAHGA